jgi:SecD/SecF fusion protein
MHQKNLFKTIIIVLLIAWSLWALYPTYKLWRLSPEEKTALDNEGKLLPLMEKSIRLGLDLQGGMYLTLEVDLPKLFEQLARTKDDKFAAVIAQSRQDMNVSSESFVTILQRNCQKEQIPLSRYWGERTDSESKVVSYLENEAKEAISRSLQILENRIDQFGVSEPSIRKIGQRRIVIELPGVTNPDQAKNLIGKTALLEFQMLKDATVFQSTIEKIDRFLAAEKGQVVPEQPAVTAADTSKPATEKEASQDKVVSIRELFGTETALQTAQTDTGKTDTSLVVDSRIFKENPFIALLRNARQSGREVSVPIENIKAVDRVLARPDIKALIPPGSEFLWSSEVFRVADQEFRELYLVTTEPEITGQYLTDARVTIGSDAESAGMPEVNFTLNRTGGRIFSRVSGANIGKRLGIVLDEKVVSSPRIQTKIPDGRGRITGIATMDEAKMVSIVLKAGALPAPVEVIEERTVGPSLGQDSIGRAKLSAIVGTALTVAFMIMVYMLSGVVADIALILNIVILMAALAQFRFSLTMPGVAGMVLTIGMAVDANVLVYERIREELQVGKTVRAAIDAGYARAFLTILDSNLTTLFTALVLYQFGTGPIRGFAVTLSIGIIVSMFTALVVTRVIFDAFTSRRVVTKLSIG